MSELSDRLVALPVPDHGPDFWNALEAQLAHDPTASDTRTVPRIGDVDAEVDAGDGTIVDLTASRARRWALTVAVTAAAVIAAVIGLNTISDDDPPTITDNPPTTTTATTTTAAPLEEDAAPDPSVDLPAALQWSGASTNLPPLAADAGVAVGAVEEGLFALDLGTAAESDALLRSDDGLAWEPVDVSAMRVGDISPSWSSDDSSSDFAPATLEVSGRSVRIVEITTEEVIPPSVRIWSSQDGDQWSLIEVGPTADPEPDAVITSLPAMSVAASPDTLVVALQPQYDVDWWQFDPGDWDPEGIRAEVLAERLLVDLPIPAPTRDGIRFAGCPPPECAFDVPPLVPWEELRPAARETYEWLLTYNQQSELHFVGPDGDATELAWPFERGLDDIQWPFGRGLDDIQWTGTQFVAWTRTEPRLSFSEDGLTWEDGAVLPRDVEIDAVVADTVLASRTDPGRSFEHLVSTDLGATFNPIQVDLPGFDEAVGWYIESQQGDSIESQQGDREDYFTVHDGVATAVARREGDIVLLRSTNGVDWAISPLEPEVNRLMPPIAVVTPDGTSLVYARYGIEGELFVNVAVGRPTG